MVHPPCIGYTIVFTDDALKDLRKIAQKSVEHIFSKVRELADNSCIHLNIKKLKSKLPLYRLRIGDYRVVYSIRHEEIMVHVVAVGHRKDVYNHLDRRLKKAT